MSRTVSRLLLTLSLLVGSATTYILLYIVFEQSLWSRDAEALVVASLVTTPVFVVLWTSIWHVNVVWSPPRLLRTTVVLAVGLIAGVGCYAICVSIPGGGEEIGVVLSTMCWVTIWIGGTAMVWKETHLERSRRLGDRPDRVIPCPKCGYDLKGLAMARCPECGTEFTLDELFATWVGQDSRVDE